MRRFLRPWTLALGISTSGLRFCSQGSQKHGTNPELEDVLYSMQTQIDGLKEELTSYVSSKRPPAPADPSTILPLRTLHSVVKIFCTTSHPNLMLPWQRKQQTTATGSGFVLDTQRKLIITNSHVVVSAAFIEVRKHGGSNKYTAHIEYMAADCDLALLSVADSEFWDSVEEIEIEGVAAGDRGVEGVAKVGMFAGLPELQRSVKVVGYPWGGEQISITSGVVSRIDSSPYGGFDIFLMAIQIDAAINPGNSGGPALAGHKVVGIAFQSLVHGDNIGYIIPIPVIAHFLRHYEKQRQLSGLDSTRRYTEGHYHPGFCSIGCFIQDMHNCSLRERFRMPPGQSGVLVLDILPTSAALGTVLPEDVLISVAGHAVGNDATIEWRGNERVRFSHVLQMASVGDRVPVTVLREGNRAELDVNLSVSPLLVPNHLMGPKHLEKPCYHVFGGCVFTQLTLPLLLEWGQQEWFNTAPRHLVDYVQGGKVTPTRDEIVVLQQMLPHKVNKGYLSEHFNFRIISHIDGVEVRNLAHFRRLLEECKGPLVHLSAQNNVNTMALILPVEASRTADEEIRALYNIPK